MQHQQLTVLYLFPSAGNSQTNLNSIGTSSIKFNVDTNSGSGGVEVWSGGVSPAKVAGINGSGALQIAGVTNGTWPATTEYHHDLHDGWFGGSNLHDGSNHAASSRSNIPPIA